MWSPYLKAASRSTLRRQSSAFQWQHDNASPKDYSRVDVSGRAYAGSQRQIQTYVNERQLTLGLPIAQSLPQYNVDEQDLGWVSPWHPTRTRSTAIQSFSKELGLGHLSTRHLEFWPRRTC